MESMRVQTIKERISSEVNEAATCHIKGDEQFSSVEHSSDMVAPKINEENLQQSVLIKPNQQDPTQANDKAEVQGVHFISNNDEMSEQSSQEVVPKLTRSGREQKFKRSTNNSHKKFISVARRWVFKNNPSELKHAFESKYKAFKSTRTYFFIILAFIKSVMSVQKQNMFFAHFQKEVSAKITQYQRQIENTQMENLKHFRSDQITDLKFSIQAAQLYFQGDIDKSIQCVYKKDKITIVKKQHYEQALKIVKAIQEELQIPNSVEDMINKYGSKKPKSKRLSLQNSENKVQKTKNEKNLTEDFMFSGFMDLQRALGLSENLFFNRSSPKQVRRTQAQRDQSSEEQLIQKTDSSQKEGKKINNILVIPPLSQNQLRLGWDSFLKKPSEVGFRPYRKQ